MRMHAPRRLDGVGGRVRERVGKSGKEWERGLPSALFGGEGISGKANGGWERGAWTDRRTVPSLPLVPYSFPISPFSPPHRPFSLLHTPISYPLCSLFSPLCSLSVPYSFPIFTQISPHFPTYARICAHISPFPYPSSHLDIPVRLYFRAKTPLCMRQDAPVCLHTCAHMHIDTPIYTLVDPYVYAWMDIPTHTLVHTCVHGCLRLGVHMDAFPHTTVYIRPGSPGCTHRCTYGRTPGCRPGHIPRCMYKGVCRDARMDTSLPSRPDVPTYRYPSADLHPGTSAHMHGEAPIRPSMDMGPRIGGSVPSPHYRYTDKYTRKDRHMYGHIGKRGRSHRKKGEDRHMGARTVLWIWGCMWSYVCTRGSTPSPPILGKNGGVYPYCWVGGWKKWGPTWGKRGATRKNPRPMGENGGWTMEGGEKSPRDLWEPMERARLYGARRDAFGEGDGNFPVRHAPVALRYPKSLSGGIGEYLGAPGCTHTTTHPPVCTCGDRYLSVPRPAGVSRRLSWQPEIVNSQKEIPLRCARGNYDAHARQPPSRMRGFLYPYHGSSSLGFPIYFGLCHLSQCAMYLDIAFPGGSGRL